VTVDVPIVLVGEAAPDTLVTVEHNTVSLEAEATHLPENIEVDIEGLAAGTQILGKDLVLPSGATLALDEEALIVNISAAQTEAALEADLAEAEADLGIEHDEPEDETAPVADEESDSQSGDSSAE